MPAKSRGPRRDEPMRRKLAELMLLSVAVVPCVPKFLNHLYSFYYLWGGKH
jgi:hypothetical protein